VSNVDVAVNNGYAFAGPYLSPVLWRDPLRGLQADVPGIEKYQQAMDNADQELERSNESIRDHL
jgi:hypothetical protein